MIDTHCHLTEPRLHEQLAAVMERAAAAGVAHVITIGTHSADWPACLDVCRQYPNVRCALGVHPNYCHEADLTDLQKLRSIVAGSAVDSPLVALGEMGLDYHHADSPRQRQAEFFRAQLEMAIAADRPVVIHCREAVDDALAILKDYPAIRGVFHCFTGTAAESRRIVSAGFYVGFTGVVTYKNAPEVRQSAFEMPADRLLVETDAPWLSPEPMRRQKINEPALVIHTAEAIAAVRHTTGAEIDRISTANAARLFAWPRQTG
jgi:TatD DNase family protein